MAADTDRVSFCLQAGPPAPLPDADGLPAFYRLRSDRQRRKAVWRRVVPESDGSGTASTCTLCTHYMCGTPALRARTTHAGHPPSGCW